MKTNCAGLWQLTLCGSGQTLPARVPGSVYSALLDAGQMEDPFWRDNELEALALMEQDFIFATTIQLEAGFVQQATQLLCFDGVDTIAEVTLNGRLIGKCNNMHRRWRFDVAGVAKAGDNELRVHIQSPTQYIRAKQAVCEADGSTDAMAGFPHIRKAHYMFGWDWGPRLPDAGLWRDVYFLARSTGAVENVYVRQQHGGEGVRVSFDIQLADGAPDARLQATLTAPDGTVYTTEAPGEGILLENPALWWPRGYGEQPLYMAEIRLLENGEVVDSWQHRIGLRTIEVEQPEDEYGQGFAFVVNGVPIFSMGADYIPEDNIISRVTPATTRRLLEDCAAANYNTVRIWGGGYYPGNNFFDDCDELGLLVWQDFMTACAILELDEEMAETLRAEYTDNLLRLRNHASLAIWCGNNEIEDQVLKGEWKCTPKQKQDYLKIYERMLPELLLRYDPQRFYWPSSPSNGGGFDDSNNPNRGDVHYWAVWHDDKPFTDYRNYHFRYVSEFGFQSFPHLATVETFTLPEDRNIFSYVMEKHQRNASANGKILNYLSSMYLYPTSFDGLLYASQLLQADAIRYGVEHWRRNRGRCMGAVYWQVNDCWPVASWSSIDSTGRWKALHYYAKRFFAPVLLSCCEESVLNYSTNINKEGYAPPCSFRLSLANESRQAVQGTVHWEIRGTKGEVLQSHSQPAGATALESLWLDEVRLDDLDIYTQYLAYRFEADGKTLSEGTTLFCQPKHFCFEDPALEYVLEDGAVTVKAAAYAKSVELVCEDAGVVFEDNFFDLNGGQRTVKILRGQPQAISLRSVYSIR